MRIADAGARDRIVDVAARLFYSEGVRTVGLQRVIEECSCGKNLLYTHFPSKDDLVGAYLERMSQAWSVQLQRELALDEGDPAAQLIGVVRATGRDVATSGYRGCPFLNTAAEYPDTAHPVRAMCAAHVAGITATVHGLAVSAGLRDPQQVTDQLMLVINGLRASGADLGLPAVATSVSLAKQIVSHAARPGT
jgi:AcrR family transcriptional regulator